MKKNLVSILTLATTLLLAACGGGHPSALKAQNAVGHRVIYEMNIGSFTAEGTFAAAETRLTDLKEMGFDILWLMPVYPRGSSKSPYAVMDFADVNPSYGTVDDLKTFVATAHEQGLKVIMDWVPNQTANEHPWRTEHPSWYNGKHTYSDISDLDYDNEEMKAEMMRIMKSWIDRCDIDGFRFDFVVNTKPSYWLSANQELKDYANSKNKEELILLAEIDTNDNPRFSNKTNPIGFTHDYAWWLQETVLKNGFAKDGSVSALKTNLQKFVTDSKSLGLTRMVYLTNHDQNWNDGGATLEDMYGANRYALTVLAFTLYGMPLLYNGQEIGGQQKLDYFNDTKIDWNSVDEEMVGLVKQLCELKHTQPAMHDAADVEFLNVSEPNILAYTRKQDDNILLIALNLGDTPVDFTVNGNSLSLPAHGYKWLVEGTSSIQTVRNNRTDGNCLYALSGRRVDHITQLPKGIYIRHGRKFVKL